MRGKGMDTRRAGQETGTNRWWPDSGQLLFSIRRALSFSISPVTVRGRGPRGKVSWGWGEARPRRHRTPILPVHEGSSTPGQAPPPQPNTKPDQHHLAQTRRDTTLAWEARAAPLPQTLAAGVTK